MKKVCKKIIVLLAVMTLAFSLVQATASAAKIGSVIGSTRSTDIVATINGYQLQSYNVNDYTYICVEDLMYYGFNVQYNDNTRTLSVTRNYGAWIDPQNTNPGFWSISSNVGKKNILYTDIGTYLNGQWVNSSNINGYTIINFDELSRFGEVAYDDSRRVISLFLEDVNYNQLDAVAANLHENIDYNSTWKYRFTTKGDVLMVTMTGRWYFSKALINDYIANTIPSEKEGAWSILNMLSEGGIPVSSVYCECRNSDGSYITSFQIP